MTFEEWRVLEIPSEVQKLEERRGWLRGGRGYEGKKAGWAPGDNCPRRCLPQQSEKLGEGRQFFKEPGLADLQS